MAITGPLYCGERDGCVAFLSASSRWYVYILRHADGRPFYVGKGTGGRVVQHENEARHPNDRRSNSHKLNVIRAIWKRGSAPLYEIDSSYDDESTAYRREAELIAQHGRLHEGDPLTNRATGGGTASQGPSPFSKQRHTATLSGIPDDDPQTAVLNRFVLAIGPMKSVVLKPVSRFTPKPTQMFPRTTRALTQRQAIALTASAAANGISLDAGCEIPRKVLVDDVDGFVENGVSCDILTSGAAEVVPAARPEDEVFRLTTAQARKITGLVGRKKCFDLGVISAIGESNW